jgi:hypothetical protein
MVNIFNEPFYILFQILQRLTCWPFYATLVIIFQIANQASQPLTQMFRNGADGENF